MSEMDFFPQRPDSSPKVYAYEHIGVESHKGYIKVGYTERDVDTRIKEQLHTAAVPYRLLAYWNAMKNDGSEYDSLFNLRHSDCYEVYGMTRTGYAGCPFNRRFDVE